MLRIALAEDSPADEARMRGLVGRFADERGIINDNDLLFAKSYELEDGRLAVTLWNDSGEALTPKLEAPGRELISFETVDSCSDAVCELAPDSVAVAVYSKIR